MKTPKAKWTLPKFFEKWYVPTATTTRRRKPTGLKTIQKRRVAVQWWKRIMATADRPKGPKLNEITDAHLERFRDGLLLATYNRGYGDKPLSPVTQRSHLAEIIMLLAAAGPLKGASIRAGLLTDPPRIYSPEIAHFPKPTWTLDEARRMVAAIDTYVPRRWTKGVRYFRSMMRAYIGFLAYTGHRASTPLTLMSADVQTGINGSFIDIVSVKTGKPVRVPLHPQLLQRLNELGGRDRLIDWPLNYRSFSEHTKSIQAHAGFASDRIFSPQAWRRWHATRLIETGFNQAQDLASSSLGHSSAEVTKSHYGDAQGLGIMRLPNLWPEKSELKQTDSVGESREVFATPL